MKKSVPVFRNQKCRDTAFLALKLQFSDINMEIDTAWAGANGIEIKAEEEELKTVIGFIKNNFSSTVDHFVCIN